MMKKLLKISRWIYDKADYLINKQPYRNQEFELVVFTMLFISSVFGSIFSIFDRSLVGFIACSVGAGCSLFVTVTLHFVLDNINEMKTRGICSDNCASNYFELFRVSRHKELDPFIIKKADDK